MQYKYSSIFEECSFNLFTLMRAFNDDENSSYAKYRDYVCGKIYNIEYYGNRFKNRVRSCSVGEYTYSFSKLESRIALNKDYLTIISNERGITHLSDIISLYKRCIDKITWRDEDYSLANVRDFALFLDIAEKAFMYDNSDNSELYSTISGSAIILKFTTEDYSATVKIDKTKLPDLGSFLSATTDDEYAKLFDTKAVYRTSIEIKRTIGNKSISTFDYLSNTKLEFTDPIVDIIFTTFRTDLHVKIKNTFDNILQSIIDRTTVNKKISFISSENDEDNNHWRMLKNYGLWNITTERETSRSPYC